MKQRFVRLASQVQAGYHKIEEYLDSDQFESDLDEYAAVLKLDWTLGKSRLFKHPKKKIRVAAKASAIVHHCRGRIAAMAATSASATASVILDPRIISGVALACSTGLAIYYLWAAAEILMRERSASRFAPVPA